MKTFLYIISSILIIGCTTKRESNLTTGEEKLSLNGYWKFNSFLGDGSNYLDIKPEGGDIVFDNQQVEYVEVKGNWQAKKVGERGTTFWGEDYLAHNYKKDNDPAFVKFKLDAPSGYYEHFIHYPAGSHMSAFVSVQDAKGLYTKDYNQKTRPSVWLSLGIFKIEKGVENFIKFSAVRKGVLNADAVMLRPVNTEQYENALEEKTHVTETDYEDSNWQELKVPGHFGMINKYSNYSGKGWYRKELDLPKYWNKNKEELIKIRFEGVYHVAKVYLNGKYLGEHQGGFTPFEFDITEQLNFSGKNVLSVEANNDYLVGATWNWGGIIRDVALIKINKVYIKRQYIHAEPNLKTGTASYTIKVRLENKSAKDKSVRVEAEISKEETLETITEEVTVQANGFKELELNGKLTKEQVKLWHFDRPELYVLETTVTEKGDLLHKKKDRFGIRKFEATATQMLLNGEPVRLVGFNRVSDHRYWGSAEAEELINFDVDLMKTAGANFTRIMHGTQNKKLIERCDEKGILLFEEANIRDLRMPEIYEENYKYPKQWMKEMIERDANHASIVGWSVGNELSDHFEYVKMMYEYTKKLDPHRLALHVSNRGYRKGESPENNPLEYGNMIFQNIYQKNPGAVMDTLHARWPNKAMFFSEFGAGRFTTPSLDNDIPGLATWYDNLRGQRSYTTGASIWTYNDYKSGYSQTLAEENRAWGMVNAWRTKRRSFYTHQKENSPVKEFKVTALDLEKRKAKVSFWVRDAKDFPSYTMKDYTLRYTFKDVFGKIVLQDEMDLPTLTPTTGKWEGDISWNKILSKVFELQVELVSTNGYTRSESKTYFKALKQPEIDVVKTANNSIRVHFTKQYGAFEHYLKYKIKGVEKESYKTIANYIDLDSLPVNTNVELQLIAVNSKGDSPASKTEKTSTKGKLLAPIIWDGFIVDNTLVVGYSGTFEDEKYQVKYGSSKEGLNKTSALTNAHGIMTIPLQGEEKVYFQIKRITTQGESQWSNTVKGQVGKFKKTNAFKK